MQFGYCVLSIGLVKLDFFQYRSAKNRNSQYDATQINMR